MSPAQIRRTFHLLIVALVAASAGPLAAQGKEATAVSAWIAAPAAGATDAVAYVEINNPTMYDIFVLSATAPATAGKVELRAAATAGAEPAVVTEFPVPSYGSTSAAVGAPHLRLLGLTRPLKAGDAVALTLTINDGTVLKVSAQVRAQ
jgi:copper(I)-binding protein